MNMKRYLENCIRGWLPEEPNLQGFKRTIGQHGLANKRPVAGIVLLSLGVAFFLFSFLVATRTDTVIDNSFALSPNEKYGPYQKGTYYHTHITTKTTLLGEVTVEGESISLTVNGYNTEHLKNISIDQNYSLVIKPADDQYTFTFENAAARPSSVNFTLKETWIDIISLMPAFITMLLSAPIGTMLIVRGLSKKTSKKEEIC